jgi:hypothetical protein
MKLFCLFLGHEWLNPILGVIREKRCCLDALYEGLTALS